MTRSSLGCHWGASLAKRRQIPWLSVFAISIALGIVTVAFVIMKHDLNDAVSFIRHRLDNGLWNQVIQRQWYGPDIASVFAALVFFSGIWLVPAVTIRHYAADGRRGFLCLVAICSFAALLVLLLAIGSFTIVYSNTEIVANAFSWSSVWAAGIAACVLLFCGVLFVLGCRGTNGSGQPTCLADTQNIGH